MSQSQDVSRSDSDSEETWQDAAEVGSEASRDRWAVEARPVLIDTAGHYHAVVTVKELADKVQTRSGVRTKQLTQHWIGDVLLRVSRDCEARGEPLLSALCVNASGSVGNGYAQVVEDLRGEPIGDADDHAARERLACYRKFGATIPADGGRPALVSRLAAARTRSRKQAWADRVIAVCPKCQLALPANGECNYCD